MKKEKQKDGLYIKKLKYFAKWTIIIGIITIAGGFFM